MLRFDYHVVVLCNPDGRSVAFVKGDGPDEEAPLRGEGETPLLALADLAASLREWHQGGSERWLTTPTGRAFFEECKTAVNGERKAPLN